MNAVFFFTSALFLAGYVLQQQTLHSLQEVIKPRLPSPHTTAAQSPQQIVDQRTKASRNPFSVHDASSADAPMLSTRHTFLVDVDWKRLAYLQVVKSHAELCTAVMMFAELVRARSPAQRLLIFPRHWALDKSNGEQGSNTEEDLRLYTTRRLLKKAARRYMVVLVPFGTIDGSMNEMEASSYSMAPAFSLVDYDRIVLLPRSGVLLSATPLDSFLAFSESTEAVTSVAGGDDLFAAPLLIQPGRSDYTRITTTLKQSESPISDDALLKSIFPSIPVVPGADDESTFFTTSSSLTDYPAAAGPATEFSATHFLLHTSFVKLEDRGLPGPEYDVPYAIRAEARPRNEGARHVWERVYESFRARRQDVCGLDLEPWARESGVGNESREL